MTRARITRELARPGYSSLAMTDKQWQAEVQRAVDGMGLPWRVHAAWFEQDNTMWCADLTDTRTGKERSVRLARAAFESEQERRAEIVRQLRR